MKKLIACLCLFAFFSTLVPSVEAAESGKKVIIKVIKRPRPR